MQQWNPINERDLIDPRTIERIERLATLLDLMNDVLIELKEEDGINFLIEIKLK